MPEYTFDCNALGTLRLLEAIRRLGLIERTRFYQASTSEMFGAAESAPQHERTPFRPRSPYGVSKLAAHWHVATYRTAYGLFACSGILFNHESPRRGESFVSRKITLGLARVRLGRQERIELGNLDAVRDWGHARDYVDAQWRMLQLAEPDDFVIATGTQHSVREFIAATAAELGLELGWRGQGTHEHAVALRASADGRVREGQVVIRIDPSLLRPAEVPQLRGDASHARRVLGWSPRSDFAALVREMVAHDLALVRGDAGTG
jgi:GDPmannose 4,6-dehydratase